MKNDTKKKKGGNFIGVSTGITLSLGNMEFIRFDAWVQEEIEDGYDKKEKMKELWELVDQEIKERTRLIRKGSKEGGD